MGVLASITVFIAVTSGYIFPLKDAQLHATFRKNGTVQFRQGATLNSISIRDDIVGCNGRVFDGSTGEVVFQQGWEAKVLSINSINQGKAKHAILMLISSVPNCNIQGNCGAGDPNISILLLRIDHRMREVSRQRVDIEHCIEGSFILEVHPSTVSASNENEPNWIDRIKAKEGQLVITFKRYKNGQSFDNEAVEICKLTYDAKNTHPQLDVEVLPKKR